MRFDRRSFVTVASLALLSTSKIAAALDEGQPYGLYQSADPKVILEAARALLKKDEIGTLITTDGQGQPRARSILVSPPDQEFWLWMGTRKGSRKLAQIAAQPRATLHFSDDASAAYLSLMGEAHVERDPLRVAAKNPYQGAMLQRYFPLYPDDFILIGFKPRWLEVMTSVLAGEPRTWQPQGITME